MSLARQVRCLHWGGVGGLMGRSWSAPNSNSQCKWERHLDAAATAAARRAPCSGAAGEWGGRAAAPRQQQRRQRQSCSGVHLAGDAEGPGPGLGCGCQLLAGTGGVGGGGALAQGVGGGARLAPKAVAVGQRRWDVAICLPLQGGACRGGGGGVLAGGDERHSRQDAFCAPQVLAQTDGAACLARWAPLLACSTRTPAFKRRAGKQGSRPICRASGPPARPAPLRPPPQPARSRPRPRPARPPGPQAGLHQGRAPASSAPQVGMSSHAGLKAHAGLQPSQAKGDFTENRRSWLQRATHRCRC